MVRTEIVVPAILFLLGCACRTEPVQVIEPELEPYIQDFFAAGNPRGYSGTLETVDLIAEFGSTQGDAEGQCQRRRNRVTVDRERWEQLSEDRRKWLVFHELGHCLLNRDHRNDLGPAGVCQSVMRGTEGGFSCSTNFFSELWFNYYLNELFNPDTPLPDWLVSPPEYPDTENLPLHFHLDSVDTNLQLDLIPHWPEAPSLLEVRFKNPPPDQNLLKYYLGNIGFSHCDRCSGTNVRVSSQQPLQVFYENKSGEFQFGGHIRMSLLNRDGYWYFYVNKHFVHVLEQKLLVGRTFSTIFFEQPMEIELDLFALE